MSFLQQQYILKLSSQLRNFTKKSNNTFNFSCVFCGDSEKNTRKARGYFYEAKGKFRYHCHNCGQSTSFEKFLKNFSPYLYKEYMFELIGETNNKPFQIETYIDQKYDLKDKLDYILIENLHQNHAARKFLAERKIPQKFFKEFGYVKNFKSFTNELIPNKFDNLNYDRDRIILPFKTQENLIFGYSGRSIDNNGSVKYIHIILDESYPKAFGLERVNFNKPYYIVEGQFDSLFLENCIACTGSELSQLAIQLGHSRDQITLIYDNEPRNKQIVGKIESAINHNFKVCIFPSFIPTGYDINDCIIKLNMTGSDIQSIIDYNTFSGLEAKLQFHKWKKI